MAQQLKLSDDAKALLVGNASQIPNRRVLTQLLHAVITPICQRFAEAAGKRIEDRVLLDELPVPHVQLGQHEGNPGIGRLPDFAAGLANQSDLTMPVGAYGFDFGLTLWSATRQLVADWHSYVEQSPDRSIAKYGSPEHLALAVAAYQHRPKEIICEAIQSVGQALCQLSSYVVPGYEGRPDRLLAAIARSGVMNDYAGLLTFSHLADMCRDGSLYPVAPLQPAGSGQVRISPQLRERLWPARQKDIHNWKTILADATVLPARDGNAQRGAGCPGRYGSIDILTKLVVQQAEMVMQGRAQLPPKALGIMSRQGYRPFVISDSHLSGINAKSCPAHSGIGT